MKIGLLNFIACCISLVSIQRVEAQCPYDQGTTGCIFPNVEVLNHPSVISANQDFTFDVRIILPACAPSFSGEVIIFKEGGLGTWGPTRDLDTFNISIAPDDTIFITGIAYPKAYYGEVAPLGANKTAMLAIGCKFYTPVACRNKYWGGAPDYVEFFLKECITTPFLHQVGDSVYTSVSMTYPLYDRYKYYKDGAVLYDWSQTTKQVCTGSGQYVLEVYNKGCRSYDTLDITLPNYICYADGCSGDFSSVEVLNYNKRHDAQSSTPIKFDVKISIPACLPSYSGWVEVFRTSNGGSVKRSIGSYNISVASGSSAVISNIALQNSYLKEGLLQQDSLLNGINVVFKQYQTCLNTYVSSDDAVLSTYMHNCITTPMITTNGVQLTNNTGKPGKWCRNDTASVISTSTTLIVDSDDMYILHVNDGGCHSLDTVIFSTYANYSCYANGCAGNNVRVKPVNYSKNVPLPSSLTFDLEISLPACMTSYTGSVEVVRTANGSTPRRSLGTYNVTLTAGATTVIQSINLPASFLKEGVAVADSVLNHINIVFGTNQSCPTTYVCLNDEIITTHLSGCLSGTCPCMFSSCFPQLVSTNFPDTISATSTHIPLDLKISIPAACTGAYEGRIVIQKVGGAYGPTYDVDTLYANLQPGNDFLCSVNLPITVFTDGYAYQTVSRAIALDFYLLDVNCSNLIDPSPEIFIYYLRDCTPLPVISVNGIELSSSSSSNNSWYKNNVLLNAETQSTLQVLEDGSYTLEVNTNGCHSFANINYEGIAYNNGVITAPDIAGAIYEWYKDGVLLPSRITNSFVPDATGLYRVSIQFCTDCRTTTTVSATFYKEITTLTTAIVREEEYSTYIVYPNPSKEKIYVNARHHDQFDAVINIRDLSGKVLMVTSQTEIDISALPEGMYIIEICSPQEGCYVTQFMKTY